MAAVSPSKLKESIRQSFRKACLMRLDGKEADAVKILQEELPALIKEWHELDGCEPAEVEGLLAEELARTESAHWVVKELENRVKKGFEGVLTPSQAEAMHTVLEAKHQLEIANLRAQVESSLAELKGRLEKTLGEVITYSGAEALGGRISQELSERLRATIAEAVAQQAEVLKRVPSKEDFEIQVDGIRAAVIEASLKKADLETALKDLPLRNEVQALLEQNRTLVEGRLQASEALALKKEDIQQLLGQAQSALEARLQANEATALKRDDVQSLLGQTQSAIEGRLGHLSELATKREMESLVDHARAGIIEASVKKQDLESSLWQAQSAITDKLEGRLKALEAESEKNSQAINLMIAEVRTLLSEELQKLVSAEAFEARLMAATQMLHEAQSKEVQEATARVEAALERRLNETVGPVHQRVSSLITFADWERVNREASEKTLIQFDALQTQALGSLNTQQAQSLTNIATQQQNFLAGLQRDWELLNKNLEELKRRQVALEADLRGVAVVVDDFRQEQAKTRENLSGTMAMMTEQLKAMDDASRQLKMTLPQALQNFERQTETRLRDQAQLYQAELGALHVKLEAALTDAFGKKLKSLKVVAE